MCPSICAGTQGEEKKGTCVITNTLNRVLCGLRCNTIDPYDLEAALSKRSGALTWLQYDYLASARVEPLRRYHHIISVHRGQI